MTSSLVGSEMCIRDSSCSDLAPRMVGRSAFPAAWETSVRTNRFGAACLLRLRHGDKRPSGTERKRMARAWWQQTAYSRERHSECNSTREGGS
eukprot:2796145-Prorocentrum_lima.AAC.1